MQRTRAHRFTPVMTTLKDIVNEVKSRLHCARMRARARFSTHACTHAPGLTQAHERAHARTHEALQSVVGRVQSTV